jgi:hypothetical protein
MIGIFLAGIAIGWAAGKLQSDRDIRELVLAEQLGTAGLCVGSLRLIDEGRPTTLRELLHGRLESSIRDADRLVSEWARLRGAVPNLRQTARDSAEYLATAGSEVSGKAERLARTIEN